MDHTFDLASRQKANITLTNRMSSLTDEIPDAMSDGISGKLQLNPIFGQDMGEADKALLNKMLDQIQSLTITAN